MQVHPAGDRTDVRAVRKCADLVRPAAQPRLARGLRHARVSVTSVERVFAPRTREDRTISSATLASRYAEVRAHTEALAAPLSGEDQTVQSMPDVSPTKWHRAHTTWFFETFVLPRAVPRYREFDPQYGYLFNSYYEAVGARHPRAERGLVVPAGHRGDRARTGATSTRRCSTRSTRWTPTCSRSSSSGCTTSSSTRNCC